MTGPIIPPTKPTTTRAGLEETAEYTTPDITLPEGRVEIDESVIFEVEALAQAAASDLAGEVSCRIKKALEFRRAPDDGPDAKPAESQTLIFFLDEKLVSALALDRAFRQQCGVLKRAFESAETVAREAHQNLVPGGAKKKGATLAVAPVAAGLSAAANLLGFFRTDTSYYGRKVTVSERALVMELARRLSDSPAVRFRWPSLAVAPSSMGRDDSDARFAAELNGVAAAADTSSLTIHKLAVAVQNLTDTDQRLATARRALDRAYDIDESASAIFAELRESFLHAGDEDRPSPAYLLQLASDVCAAIGASKDETKPTVYFLTAVIETAGGNYRVRKHLWQVLTREKPLTVSGGAVVSYALLNSTGDFVSAATLRYRLAFQDYPEKATTFGQQGVDGCSSLHA